MIFFCLGPFFMKNVYTMKTPQHFTCAKSAFYLSGSVHTELNFFAFDSSSTLLNDVIVKVHLMSLEILLLFKTNVPPKIFQI